MFLFHELRLSLPDGPLPESGGFANSPTEFGHKSNSRVPRSRRTAHEELRASIHAVARFRIWHRRIRRRPLRIHSASRIPVGS